MAQPKLQQEPSMEEILASIRRIIDSGDDVGRSPRAARDNAAASREESSRGAPRPRDQDAREASPAEPERFGENGFVSRRPAFTFDDDAQPSDQAEAPQGEETDEQDETDREPVSHQLLEPQQSAPPRGPHPLERDTVYPGTIGEVARQVREAAGSGHQAAGQREEEADRPQHWEERQDSLLSANSEQRIGNALHALSDALDREGARRIEEIVVAELRPLLREWIEENMPSIVEEMVGKEIERMRNAKR